MRVVSHEPGFWYFLGKGNKCYLDVNCSLLLVDVSILVELSAEEYSEYQARGREALQNFAMRISRSPKDYFGRNADEQVQKEALEAIKEWQAEKRSWHSE
jgi:hypothetical protein